MPAQAHGEPGLNAGMKSIPEEGISSLQKKVFPRTSLNHLLVIGKMKMMMDLARGGGQFSILGWFTHEASGIKALRDKASTYYQGIYNTEIAPRLTAISRMTQASMRDVAKTLSGTDLLVEHNNLFLLATSFIPDKNVNSINKGGGDPFEATKLAGLETPSNAKKGTRRKSIPTRSMRSTKQILIRRI